MLRERPEVSDKESLTAVRSARRRRRRWAFAWASLLHAVLVLIGMLWHFQPRFIHQIGTSLTVSAEPAIDRQQESTEDKLVEEVVIPMTEAPPPEATEATIPELLPVVAPVDVRMPEPSESADIVEMEVEFADLGTTFADGLIGEEMEEEVLDAKMFSAPAKGECTIFAIDVSTSMPRELGDRGIAALRRQLRMKIDSLPEDTLFNVICFGDQADGLSSRPIQALQKHKQLAHQFMAAYFTGQFRRTRTEAFGSVGLANNVAYTPITPDRVLFMKSTPRPSTPRF